MKTAKSKGRTLSTNKHNSTNKDNYKSENNKNNKNYNTSNSNNNINPTTKAGIVVYGLYMRTQWWFRA